MNPRLRKPRQARGLATPWSLVSMSLFSARKGVVETHLSTLSCAGNNCRAHDTAQESLDFRFLLPNSDNNRAVLPTPLCDVSPEG